ncbi:MAG: 4Fe-4S binding protein [Clostridia bacterium]
MQRKIIQIEKDKCNGCGLCVTACHEAAIGLVAGKATLLKDEYCDGLGDCLPACPMDAIHLVEQEVAPYNEAAVLARLAKLNESAHTSGCPGMQSATIQHHQPATIETKQTPQSSALAQWPVQIKLAPIQALFYHGAELLIAADCSAYAYASFHQDFMQGKITLIGCPKLDNINYSEKLTEIIIQNNIKNVTVVRMEVPCCGGLQQAVENALRNSGKILPYQIVVIGTDGSITK